MTRTELISKAKEAYNKYSAYADGDGQFEFVGIRCQSEPFELGAIDHISHVWEDGFETEEELDGICAIKAERVQDASEYYGKYYAVLVSDKAEGGEDYGEIIMKDAVVIEILA